MPEPERLLQVVREWLAKADNDFNAARTLGLAKGCPTDAVCFHAQQCVEKYIKALLVLNEIDFPRTHDLSVLFALLPVKARPPMSAEEQAKLTDYATGARYPGWGEIQLAEARRAVIVARRVRAELRRSFPREALRRRKP